MDDYFVRCLVGIKNNQLFRLLDIARRRLHKTSVVGCQKRPQSSENNVFSWYVFVRLTIADGLCVVIFGYSTPDGIRPVTRTLVSTFFYGEARGNVKSYYFIRKTDKCLKFVGEPYGGFRGYGIVRRSRFGCLRVHGRRRERL